MTDLFNSNSGPHVAALKDVPRRPGLVAIVLSDRKRACTITRKSAAALGIAIGAPWTPALAHAADEAQQTLAARKKAVTLLKAKDRSAKDIQARLARAGFEPAVIAHALRELKAEGLIDDARLAQSLAEQTQRRLRSTADLSRRLRRAGVAAPARTQALETRTPKDDRAAAFALAKSLAAKLPARLDATARTRRLLGALQRQGFSADLCYEAVRKALGSIPGDDD